MARKAKEISAIEVSRLTEPGFHFVGVVPGLALQVLPSGGRTWVLRATIGGKRRDMGLGGFPDVTLARPETRRARRARRSGRHRPDVEAARRRAPAGRAAERQDLRRGANGPTSRRKRPSWRNAKHAAAVENTLETYANPMIGEPAGARRGCRRCSRCWSRSGRRRPRPPPACAAASRRCSTGRRCAATGKATNPARWRGHLDKLLPKPSKVAKVEHHAGARCRTVGAFMHELRSMEGMGARALEFAILTAARSGEVRGARGGDRPDAALWVVPAERMKAGREHRVPLSPRAVKLLKALPRWQRRIWCSRAPRRHALGHDTERSDAAHEGRRGAARLPLDVSRLGGGAHQYPSEVAEMALAHTDRRQGRGRLSARRSVRQAARTQIPMADWAAVCDEARAEGQGNSDGKDPRRPVGGRAGLVGVSPPAEALTTTHSHRSESMGYPKLYARRPGSP